MDQLKEEPNGHSIYLFCRKLFEAELPDERISEIIEPEIIDVAAHKRERKSRATYEEMFDSLPRRDVLLDTLTDGEKSCPALLSAGEGL